jgi:formylglycine-generating enzyme required for sulfatase activity
MKFVPVGGVFFATTKTRVKDYEQFVADTHHSKTRWRSPGFEQTPDHPVVMVSWVDAVSFCKWLTDRERAAGRLKQGEVYRLPTDLEWSQAVGLAAEKGATPEARDMGVKYQFPWGTQWPPPQGSGNYTGQESGADKVIAGYNDGFRYTSPVEAFQANSKGLYDLGGNAWEWCSDTWNAKDRSRVLRGGSWYQGSMQLGLLSSCRIPAAPDREAGFIGFRVVRTPASKGR